MTEQQNSELFPPGHVFQFGDLECTFRHDEARSAWSIEIVDPVQGRVLYQTEPAGCRFRAYEEATAWCKAYVDASLGRKQTVGAGSNL